MGCRSARRITVINPPIAFPASVPGTADRADVRAELQVPQNAGIDWFGRPARSRETDRGTDPGSGRPIGPALSPARRRCRARYGSVCTRWPVNWGSAEAIHFTGARPDVSRLLQAMDVFVSPSRDETFGMAVIEALAAGVPVVYAQCPALDELALRADRAVEIPRDTIPRSSGGISPMRSRA